MNPQPLIVVRDVAESRRWYVAALGLTAAHGGDEYEQLQWEGRMVAQLHRWEAHEHPHIGDPASSARGNGVVIWFQTDAFDDALARIRAANVDVLEGPQVNPNARHREIWLRDPDGYVVVVAGRMGDLG